MKTILAWLVALPITCVIILPFFLFLFLKRKNKWIYLCISTIFSLPIFIWYFFKGYDYLLDIMAKINADLYYFFDNAGFNAILLYLLLMLFSPFLFAKIFYGHFNLKRFFISLFFSALIFIILFLIFAYYIFPMAGSVLLHNI